MDRLWCKVTGVTHKATSAHGKDVQVPDELTLKPLGFNYTFTHRAGGVKLCTFESDIPKRVRDSKAADLVGVIFQPGQNICVDESIGNSFARVSKLNHKDIPTNVSPASMSVTNMLKRIDNFECN